KNHYLLARHGLQRFANVGVAAVLIGRVPEIDALVISGPEEFGDAVISQLARLVRASVAAAGSGAHRQAAQLDLARPQQDPVRRVLGAGRRKEVMWKMMQRDDARSA